jgi:hypothetical protein
LLDDRGFSLLVFGQAAPTSSIVAGGQRVRVLAIPDDRVNRAALAGAGISGQAFYVVRPDGHVGLAGTRFDEAAVVRYFAEHHVHVEDGRARSGARAATSGALPALQRSDSP